MRRHPRSLRTLSLTLAFAAAGCSDDPATGFSASGFEGLPAGDVGDVGAIGGADAATGGEEGAGDVAADAGAPAGPDAADSALRGPDAADAGGADAAPDVAVPDVAAPDAAAPDVATGDADAPAPDAGAPDAGPPPGCSGLTVTPSTPTPAAPCGADLQAVTGAVAPDLGPVPCPGTYVYDPGQKGPFTVLEAQRTVPNPVTDHDPISAKTYAPSSGGAVAPGPLPLVVVLHGFSANLSSVEAHSRHFASHGLAVVAFTFPNTGFLDPPAHDSKAKEALAVLDWAIAAPEAFGGAVDGTRVAMAGHSLGGKVAFYAAALDPRVDVVIGWDPSNAGGPPCLIDKAGCNAWPVAPNCDAGSPGLLHLIEAESLVFAAEDSILTPDAHHRAVHFYRGAPTPAHLVHFAKAGHADWTFDGDVSKLSRGVGTALLLRRFGGYEGLDAWLPGGAKITGSGLVDQASSK